MFSLKFLDFFPSSNGRQKITRYDFEHGICGLNLDNHVNNFRLISELNAVKAHNHFCRKHGVGTAVHGPGRKIIEALLCPAKAVDFKLGSLTNIMNTCIHYCTVRTSDRTFVSDNHNNYQHSSSTLDESFESSSHVELEVSQRLTSEREATNLSRVPSHNFF